LCGIFSLQVELQAHVLKEFCALKPNFKDYGIIYQAIASLGLYSSLSPLHQIELVKALKEGQQAVLFARLLASLNIPYMQLCREWFSVPEKELLSFRMLVDLQTSVLQHSCNIWPLDHALTKKDLYNQITQVLLSGEQEKMEQMIITHCLTITQGKDAVEQRLVELKHIRSQ
jgi:hypothetical protein